MDMKEYKVQFIKVDKHFASVVVSASSKKEAIALARSMQDSEFEESESLQATEWIAKKSWSIWDLFRRSNR